MFKLLDISNQRLNSQFTDWQKYIINVCWDLSRDEVLSLFWNQHFLKTLSQTTTTTTTTAAAKIKNSQ